MLDYTEFSGKTVLITGGTSGIGKAAALSFSHYGATVIFTGRSENEGIKLMEELQNNDNKAYFIRSDISSEQEATALFDVIGDRFGSIDIAFNNAGITKEKAIIDITFDDYRQLFDTNFWGVMVAMKYEIKMMLNKGGGTIVNTSSIAGHVGVPGFSAYSATKHAIEGLSKTTALEYARHGIRINTVAPAFIKTPMVDRYTDYNEERQQQLADLHPNGRLGEPSDIVNAVLFLSSSSASFITGESLRVDGGWTAR